MIPFAIHLKPNTILQINYTPIKLVKKISNFLTPKENGEKRKNQKQTKIGKNKELNSVKKKTINRES